MLKGSCLCGAVRYEIDGGLEKVSHCHCSLCRKASGSAFSTGATLPAASFRFVSGAEFIKEWESSPGNFRCFCGRCGSPIIKRKSNAPDQIRLRLGTLDSDPGVKPSRHSHVQSKAAWFDIKDGLPQSD